MTLVRVLVLTVPWPAGLVAYLLARALRISGAAGLGELTALDMRAALHRQPEPSGRADHQPVNGSRLEIWPTYLQGWRWRYVNESDPARPVRLDSNVVVGTEGEARRGARTAYPGVPMVRGPRLELERRIAADPGSTHPRLIHRLVAALWLPIGLVLRRWARHRSP